MPAANDSLTMVPPNRPLHHSLERPPRKPPPQDSAPISRTQPAVLALFRTLGSVYASGFISRTRATLFLHNPFPSRQLALHRPCPLALFRTISLVRGDAWGTAALGGDPSRGRLGYMRCPFDRSRVSPYGHPTNGSRRPPLALFHTTGCPRAIASKLAGPCFWAGNADRSAWSPTTTSSRPLRDQCFRGQDGRFEFRCVRPAPTSAAPCLCGPVSV